MSTIARERYQAHEIVVRKVRQGGSEGGVERAGVTSSEVFVNEQEYKRVRETVSPLVSITVKISNSRGHWRALSACDRGVAESARGWRCRVRDIGAGEGSGAGVALAASGRLLLQRGQRGALGEGLYDNTKRKGVVAHASAPWNLPRRAPQTLLRHGCRSEAAHNH